MEHLSSDMVQQKIVADLKLLIDDYFDANNKNQSGKWIPIDKQIGQMHF
jgi:uncharacterized protein involved in exopolysaccharide biosynthesis